MKILAIRGRNLASLGEFAVDLESPPLATAGLFAITGPTGAGKSTLLDALCLALFDRVPRLTGASSALVGRPDQSEKQRVAGSDVRSLLRRGTGEGQAEVDFLGVDGQRYRARWLVRRARKNATGNLQTQDMQLLSLPKEIQIGRTRTEVLAAIQERLGLSFDQFRRSALLAQNEFAAFLRANPKDRADLLERITGTELYGELSRRAHQRNREVGLALEALQQEQNTVAPLPPELRAAREAQLADRQGEAQAAEAALRSAERERDWYRLLEELQHREAEALSQLETARDSLAEAAPRRQHLAEVTAAQPLRSELATRDRTREALGQATTTLDRAQAEHQTAQETLDGAMARHQAAETTEAAALSQREAAAPSLNEARILDSRLAAAQEEQARQQAALEEIQRQRQASLQALEAQETSHRQASETRERVDQWLRQHQHLVPLAQQWQRWQVECQRLQESSQQLTQTTAQLAETEAQRQTLIQRHRTLETHLQTANQALAQAETARFQAESREQAASAGDLPTRRRALDEARQIQQERADWHREFQRLGQQAEAQDREFAHQAAHLASLAEQRAPLPARLDTCRGALAEAERALALAEAARGAEVQALREALRPGEPCPVCGSTEHPWQTASPLADLHDTQRERVESLRKELEDLSRREAALSAEAEILATRHGELQATRRDTAEALEALQQRWQQAAVPVPLSQAADWLAAETAQLQSQTSALEAAEHQAREARELANNARGAADEARRERDRLQQEQIHLGGEREPLERQWEMLRQRREQAAAACEASQALLAEPLAALPDLLALRESDPTALLKACQQEVSRWETKHSEQQAAEQSLAALAPQRAAAQRDLAHADTAQARAEATLAQARKAVDELTTQRATLLDGRAVTAVEVELDRTLTEAREALTSAREVRDAARVRHDQTNLALATAGERRQQAQRDLASQEQSLAAKLAQQDWTEDTLRTHLQHDAQWLAAEEEALRILDQVHQQAEVRLDERRARLSEHRASTPPAREPTALAEALPQLADTLEEAQQRVAELRAELVSDDRRREQSTALLARLAELEADCRLWGSLNDLIGSADGSKFRRFAQSLTLDGLLGHANLHLQDLTRRYRLERAPGSDLELQIVDREMGDEVRSVHSLSGGESFLASLALALGLASLAADRTPVESLFIDEGFGSLDAATLDTALASLDALQAQGRQVGVISHVPALTERIGVQLRVLPRGGGYSELRVEG